MKPQLDQCSRHTELVSIPPVLFTDNGVQASLPFKLPHFSHITKPRLLMHHYCDMTATQCPRRFTSLKYLQSSSFHFRRFRQNCEKRLSASSFFFVTVRQHRGCIIPQAVKQSIVLLKMGKIIARNMLS